MKVQVGIVGLISKTDGPTDDGFHSAVEQAPNSLGNSCGVVQRGN